MALTPITHTKKASANNCVLPCLTPEIRKQKGKPTCSAKEIEICLLGEKRTASNPVSKLLLKRRKMNLNLLTVSTEQKKSLNPFQMIQEMKAVSNENSPASVKTVNSCTTEGNLSYIFVKPKGLKSSLKETSLNEFLTGEGIFQINLPVAMNDYHFECQ
ncbi:unnamed protein product [Moneuplotes crassus]|uniref:Uncharacterized protein n=1 Tax=Euplotes crassus TaxID=5936 RepID=A0AAD1X8B5_EUPCR|nr:unnamed protein product [Moneuplotes crassus]